MLALLALVVHVARIVRTAIAIAVLIEGENCRHRWARSVVGFSLLQTTDVVARRVHLHLHAGEGEQHGAEQNERSVSVHHRASLIES
jgi:hypothetical protein